jgi:hypothetical protein
MNLDLYIHKLKGALYLSMKCVYGEHTGILYESTNEVRFYGVLFVNITEAMKLLDKIDPGYDYTPFVYREHKGFVHEDGYVIINDKEPKWFDSKWLAKQWIKGSTQCINNNVVPRKKAHPRGRLASAWF